MLDILKNRLPEGLEIVKVQDRTGASQIKIWFACDGEEVVGYLPKVCVPGTQNQVVDRTVCNAMVGVALKRQDLEMADHWMTKMMAVGV